MGARTFWLSALAVVWLACDNGPTFIAGGTTRIAPGTGSGGTRTPAPPATGMDAGLFPPPVVDGGVGIDAGGLLELGAPLPDDAGIPFADLGTPTPPGPMGPF